jgi:regulator of sigma E protease
MLIGLAVIIGLSVLILGHEAGHFLVAKLFKLKIDEFGFGFPPRMFGIRRYYGTRAVPVAVERETIDMVERDAAGTAVEEVITTEREIDIETAVKKWSFFWGKELEQGIEGLTPNDTVYSFNWLPFGGFVRIAGENDAMPGADDGTVPPQGGTEGAVGADERKRLFSFQPAWKRALITFAGVLINFVLGWLLLSIVFMIGSAPALVVTGVQPGSPAAQVGIQGGDVIIGYTAADGFIAFTDAHRGEPMAVSVRRGSETRSFTVTPRTHTGENEGAIGVMLTEAGIERMGFFAALGTALQTAFLASWLTLKTFGVLVQQLVFHQSLIEGVVGPVGIFAVAQETGSIGFLYLLNLVSLISLNLAVINLIPFPALDGGRLLFIAIEKIKGSPISRRTEAWTNGIGFAFLILLMALISVRDVAHLL